MLAKVGSETSNVVAVIYGSTRLGDGILETAARELKTLLAEVASAKDCEWGVCPG